MLSDLVSKLGGVEPTRVPKRPRQSPPTFSEVQTTDRKVQVRTSPRERTVEVQPGHGLLRFTQVADLTGPCYHAHQV